MSTNNDSNTGAFLAGFIIGGLVGAAAAIILAPQSGDKTRQQLMQQGDWLRDSAYRQRQAMEQENSSHLSANIEHNDDTNAVEDAPRIVLNGGHNSTTESAATDEEADN